MENQTASRKSIMLNYGLYYAIAPVILSLVLYATGNLFTQNYAISGGVFLLYTVAQVMVIVLGTKKARSFTQGDFSFADGLKIGIGIALIGSGVVVLFEFVLQNYIEPDFYVKSLEVQEEVLRNFGTSEKDIATAMEAAYEKGGLGFTDYGISWVSGLFKGFIISLITALVVKRTDTVDEI